MDHDEDSTTNKTLAPTTSTFTANSIPNTEELSDEEILLACRAFLQKRHRLGPWEDMTRRKVSRQRQAELAASSQSGFFWEDPSELPYYRPHASKGKPSSSDFSKDDKINVIDDEEGGEDFVISEEFQVKDEEDSDIIVMNSIMMDGSSNSKKEGDVMQYNSAARRESELEMEGPIATTRLEQVTFDFQGRHSHDRLEEWAKTFSTLPLEPAPSYRRRSQAVRKRWEDPAWKEQWYEKRWGTTTSSSNTDSTNDIISKRKQQWKHRLHQHGSELSLEFLSSDEFQNLSEEEIAYAVQMYSQANQRRSQSRIEGNRERKAALATFFSDDDNNNTSRTKDKRVPYNALAWDRDPAALEAARKARSERAKKAYQTRLQNEAKKKVKVTNLETASNNKSMISTKQANNVNSTTFRRTNSLSRIRGDLTNRRLPQAEDVESVCARVKKREAKVLLQYILRECFGVRGKRIPIRKDATGAYSDENIMSMVSLTNAKMDHLLPFVLCKLRETKNDPNFELPSITSTYPDTPIEAMLQVEDDLAKGQLPYEEDLLIIADENNQIAGKKQLFRRILTEGLGLSGSLIPTILHGTYDFDMKNKKPIKDASIQEVADYSIAKIREAAQAANQFDTKNVRSPKEAMAQVELALDKGSLPDEEDIRLISLQTRLANRRGLFERVLLEYFGLKGRCIAVDGGDQMQYIKSCKLDDLSDFILFKIREERGKYV